MAFSFNLGFLSLGSREASGVRYIKREMFRQPSTGKPLEKGLLQKTKQKIILWLSGFNPNKNVM